MFKWKLGAIGISNYIDNNICLSYLHVAYKIKCIMFHSILWAPNL